MQLLVTSLLLLFGLLGGLGLGAFDGLGGGGLDDTDSDGLPHVTDSESSKWRIVSEGLDTHGLAGGQEDDSGISRLDELGVVLNRLTSTTVNLLLDLSKLASNVSCVTIKDRAVSIADLSSEVGDSRCWLVLGVGGDVSSLDVLDRDVLDVEANVVSGDSLWERLVVHLHRLDLSGQHVGGEGDDHTGLDNTSLNSTDWNCSNTSDFVDILEWESERLVSWSGWWDDGIKSLKKSHTAGITLLPLDLPSLVPGHVG